MLKNDKDITCRSLVGDQWEDCGHFDDVLDKFTNQPFARVAIADENLVQRAISAARHSFDNGFIEPYHRYNILMRAAEITEERTGEIVERMISETGFTRQECQMDVSRTAQTFKVSAEEAKRVIGEIVPIHAAPGQSSDRMAYTVRDPIGVVCAITPFNSPFNTVCHKIAPALAAGNSVVLKPATYTPLSAVAICQILLDAGLPAGWLNLVHGGGRTVGRWLLESQDVNYYTFTGSTEVGRDIQSRAGLRRTQMELGNISGTIVCADANLEHAVSRCVSSSFRKAGQICTSVQRLVVERSIFNVFTEQLANETSKLVAGNPHDSGTNVGPMISPQECSRASEWVSEAVAGGADLVVSGVSEKSVMLPTILAGVTTGMKVFNDEIFAPVVSITPFDEVMEAINIVNDTPFGLAAGIFTSNLDKAMRAARKVRVGAFHINDTSSSRVDLMPYGGVKSSGFGLEGPKYAIRDMTEERLISVAMTQKY